LRISFGIGEGLFAVMSSTNASPQAGTPEDAATPTAGTLAGDTARSTGALALRRVRLSGRPYRAMLEGYVCRRLALSPRHKPADAQLLDAIIATADHRFAYVAFLTERCQRGREDADSLRRAAAEAPADPPANDGADASGDAAATAPTAGEALYRRWLAGLHLEYGHKLAERMRAVLALLHAAEQAHAWVFGAGRIEHPVTGAALTPLPEQFQGLPLAVLQTLLLLEPPRQAALVPVAGSDIGTDSPEPTTPAAGDPNEISPRPADAYNPALLLTLQQLQGVLAVHRGGSGTSRFRIGLKDLGPALAQDEQLAPLVRRAPALLAGAALDAVEAIAAGSEAAPDAPGPQPSRQPDWPLFEALAPLLDALVTTLSDSEPVAARWAALRETAMRRLSAEDEALEQAARADLRLPVLSLLATWYLPSAQVTGDSISSRITADPVAGNKLAGCLSTRGYAYQLQGGLHTAIADYSAAVVLAEAIRDAFNIGGGESAWATIYRVELARALQNRGAAHASNGDSAAAMADYVGAIELLEDIRYELIATGGEGAWEIPYRNFLAGTLCNRGCTHIENGNFILAIADLGEAITLREGVRDTLIASDCCAVGSISYLNDLAVARSIRGSAHQSNGDLPSAIIDYDAAVQIEEDIRNVLVKYGGESAWTINYRRDYAATRSNRGLAHARNREIARAISDHDAAIRITEGIRDTLIEGGGDAAWSIPQQDDLALAYQNRAFGHELNGNFACAGADYSVAISIQEGIRDFLIAAGGEDAWSIEYRRNLAVLRCGLANVHRANGELTLAIPYYDEAIRLFEGIRAAQVATSGEAALSIPYSNEFATVRRNRGVAHWNNGDLAAAIADFDAAIQLGQDIRDALLAASGEAAWPAPLRVDLAGTHSARAHALGAARGRADFAAAAEIAAWLRAEGHAQDAAQVQEWCTSVLLHWGSGAVLSTLREQNPRVFWLLHVVVAPIWLILLPIALLVRAVRWLRRRSG
jgi:tetratricopeptide (TPR) repeat protein